MSAHLANALKVLIEQSGLGLAAYRDAAPDDQQKPYVTIQEGIAITPDDFSDGGKGSTGTETVQVDLWESWKDEDNNIVESPSLANAVNRVLHGAMLETAPTRVYGVSVVSQRRLLEPRTNVVHNAITANVRREL